MARIARVDISDTVRRGAYTALAAYAHSYTFNFVSTDSETMALLVEAILCDLAVRACVRVRAVSCD
jgi:hypothetical protein